MASLWDTLTGFDRKNSSSEQLKREAARQAAEEAARRKAEKEAAEKAAAEKAVREITFKRGGAVKKAPAKSAIKRPVAKAMRKR